MVLKFKRNLLKSPTINELSFTTLIAVIVLILILFMLSSSLTFQNGIEVKLPKAVTSDTLQEKNSVISITNENVIYFNKSVVTIKELEKILKNPKIQSRPFLIKADRRASMGRVVDVWDLCRKLGIEKLNIATNQANQ